MQCQKLIFGSCVSDPQNVYPSFTIHSFVNKNTCTCVICSAAGGLLQQELDSSIFHFACRNKTF